MKKRGFTLIELLAVIVILAIIALIATPAVLNIIEDSKKGAAEASARNIISAAKTYYMSETMNGRTPNSIDLSGTTLKYDGDQASKGSITFTNGKASGKLYINGYCVEVAVNGKVTSEKKTEDECEITVTPSETVYTKYNTGAELLFDPVNNVKCTSATSSATGTNNTCMKWYAFLDSEESSTVNLLLDHNTTAFSAWNSNIDGTTPDTVNAKLQNDITNWNEEVKATARLISAEEINRIAPHNESYNWNQGSYNTWYYLQNGNQVLYNGDSSSNKYAWLFDNTNRCELYGCNSNDSNASGYWTSSYASYKHAWGINYDGSFSVTGVADVLYYGVRPVITLDKSIFE